MLDHCRNILLNRKVIESADRAKSHDPVAKLFVCNDAAQLGISAGIGRSNSSIPDNELRKDTYLIIVVYCPGMPPHAQTAFKRLQT